MRGYRLISIAIGFSILSGFSKQSGVYICVSPTGKKYHYNLKCSGLQRCTHTIKKVSLSEAQELKYTVCLLESK